MRLFVILLLALCAIVGIVVGALNADLVDYDLAFAQVHVPKGAALLSALLIGWLLGGLTAWAGTRIGTRRKSRHALAEKTPSSTA